MNEDLVTAVKRLVEAVGAEHCTINDGSGETTEVTVDCARAVLEKIHTTPELSSLHSWAEKMDNLMRQELELHDFDRLVALSDVGGTA